MNAWVWGDGDGKMQKTVERFARIAITPRPASPAEGRSSDLQDAKANCR
jgi:hypothetical protein